MKSTDAPLDEALRRALQSKFEEFEATPSRQLSERVLDAIRQLPSGSPYRFPALILLMLSFGFGGWVASNLWVSEPRPVNNLLSGHTQNPALNKIPNGQATTKRLHRSKSALHSENPENNLNRASTQSPMSQPERSGLHKSLPAGQSAPVYAVPEQADAVSLLASTGAEFIHNKTALESTTAGRVLPLVKELTCREFNPSGGLPWPRVSSVPPPLMPAKPAKKAPRLTGVISFTPTNTFQRLTVLPQRDVRYQNFQLPALLSAQTLGYTLRAGIEKNDFQFLFNFSRFKQEVNYEIAGDVYIVEPNSSDSYTVKQEGVLETERTTHQLVGISLQKKFLTERLPLPGVFVQTGASLNHDLTTSENLAWGTLGIGKSWPAALGNSWALVPNLGFALNATKSNQGAFKNRYFQVGVSFEMYFGGK